MALPPGDWNRAWCLQGCRTSKGLLRLKWRGRHTGDYNLDGLVTVADLTPLGYHFNVTPEFNDDGLPVVSGENEWAAEVDGNVDGLIAVSDLTPIGANYQSRHAGYRLYLGTGTDIDNVAWAADFIENLDDASQPFTVPFNTSRDAGHVALYEFELTPEAPPAGEIYFVRIVAWDGSVEGEPREIPIYDGPHAPITCEFCHVMPTMAYRGPQGACHLCHTAPPEDTQASWGEAPAMHQPCMNCHTAHGFVIDPPQTPCSTCHSMIASAVSGAGMPNCLDCHETSHIPNTQLTAAGCQTCHPVPPDLPAESWDNAPGLHAGCLSCHSEHTFAISESNTVCADCHSALIDGGHAGGNQDCLGCHASPHIPETAATGMNCFDCHPNPPEDPTAEWTLAPGNHAQCILCHTGEEHGNKPVPPESICSNCHSELISSGHAGGETVCLSCHEYPHLPVINFTNCRNCHPTPPEDPTASWDDAPGQHAVCDQCHDAETHGAKPEPPESICTSCHDELIGESHVAANTECLDCHGHAHLPDLTNLTSDEQCLTCHEGYSGLGNHSGSCFDCHTGGEHPPEGGWDACANCHDY
jgi:hypothetical protein